MSEKNKTVCRRVIEEIWNKGDLSVIPELFSSNFAGHAPPETMRGHDGFRALVNKYRTAFPDTRFTIDDMMAEGDRVALRWTCRGTHKGELQGIAPTNKQVTVTGVSVLELSGGKIAKEHTNWDALGLMQQVGAIPAEAARRAGR